MRKTMWLGACVACAVFSAQAALQTAGTLLVDVKASDLSGLSNNDKVTSWPCNGSVGGSFVPVVSGQGAVYQTSVLGAPAVTFAGSANSVMTNTVLVPSSILGTNPWSAELWVINPTLENPEDQFSWTQRAGAGWGTDNAGSCMEIRYCGDWWNGVEHYGEPNIPWGVAPPVAGVWHHIAITRDSGGVERLYADGVLWTTKTPSPLNLRNNGAPFAMGGVWEGNWVMLFSGSLAKVRVHSGTLSDSDVLNNYQFERGIFEPRWAGTAGVALSWADPANWENGYIAAAGDQFRIDNGGIAVLTESVGTALTFLSVSGGLMMSNGAALAVSSAVSLGGSGTRFDLTMDGGTFEVLGGNTLNVGVQGGTGIVSVNSGLLNLSGNLSLGEGTTGQGDLHLNGGQLRVNAIGAITGGATNRVYFNGGTLQPRVSSGTFMQGLAGAYVQTGDAMFDVAGGVAVTVAQPLLADPVSTGGGVNKYGTGTLTLGGANTFTGDILIDAGDLWFTDANGLAGYTGTITMNNTDASVGYAIAGGVSNLLARLPTGSVGKVMLFAANANDAIDFSTYPGLTLAMSGNFTYTGTYTPYGNHYVFAPNGPGNVYATAIVGASSVEVNGTANGVLELTGDSSYTAGTVINSGMLVMSHLNALGDSSSAITINSNAVLKLNVAGIPANFVQRITAGSQGVVLLGPLCADLSLDLTGRPGLIVGTDQGQLNYSGTITPDANTYRLGGGNVGYYFSGNQGLVISNLTDASASVSNKLVVETTGLVRLAAGNTYSGGTMITNNGAIFLSEDGLGAVPPSPDPSNIYVDKGVIRSAGNVFSLDANRGLTVGAGGLELHPWSTGTMAVPGDLSGSGRIFTTDSGTVIFGGANNTWSGRLDIGTSASIIVGTGTTFSWNRDVVIASIDTLGGNGQNGGYLGVNRNSDFAWSDAFANPLGNVGVNLGLRKLGTGTLTVDVAQPYTKDTLIEGGTLKVVNAGAVPSGTGKGNVGIAGGCQLDANGYDLSLNGLSGAGNLIDSNGSSTQLTVGLNDAGGTFSGAIDPDMLLVKTGAGTQTLGSGAAVNNVRVDLGLLGVVNPTSPTGTVTLTGSGGISVTGNGSDAASRFATLTAPSGTRIDIGGNGKAEVVLDADGTIGSTITGTSPSALLIKSGAGKLSLTSAASSYAGQTRVDDGSLALLDAGTLGPVEVASGKALTVTAAATTGLPGEYFDFAPPGNPATMYNSQAELEAYLLAFTPERIRSSALAGSTFDFGGNGSKFPDFYASTSTFQTYWKGEIDIPTAGTYTFYTASDDGSMLFIDGVTVVNNNYYQGVVERSGTVTLTAGTHAIAIAFFDGGGGWGMFVNIEGPGMAKQLLPNSMLHAAANQVHPVVTSSIGALSGAGSASLLSGGTVLKIDEQVNSTYSGAAAGPTNSGIAKAGSQTLTLTGNNDAFVGGWYLTAGTLQVGDGGTYGTLGGTRMTTSAGSVLAFNRSDDVNYAAPIVGTGEIRSLGTGAVTLSGSLSGYNGVIQIAPNQALTLTSTLSGSATVTNNGTLGLSGIGCSADGSRIGGTGSTLVQNGAKLTLPNPTAFPNSVALEGGILMLPSTNEPLPNLTVLPGAASGLALSVWTNDLTYTVDRLTLETGALLQVGAYKGLFGKYYNEFPSSGNAAFLSVAAFESYYAGRTPDLTASSTLAGDSFDFGSGPPTLFPGLFQTETVFAAIWKGKIRIDVEGVYTFLTRSDDNSMLFIDGSLVVDNNGPHGFDIRTGSTPSLTPGLHDIAILFGDSGGGYGLYVEITIPGTTTSQRLPNSMLIPDPADVPAYALDVATIAVTNGPGVAAVEISGAGTLRMKDLWIDTGAQLTVTSAVAVAVSGSTLTVTVPQEVPYGSYCVGDFTATPGLSLAGVTLSTVGTHGHLTYRDQKLYLVRNSGIMLILK